LTTDLATLAATHRMLGLAAPSDGISAWEAPELVLVSAPRWLDVDCDASATSCMPGRSESPFAGGGRLVQTPSGRASC
jgi:hypothetical protein